MGCIRVLGAAVLLACFGIAPTDAKAAEERALTGTVTGYYYAVPDEPNFGAAIASLNLGSLHLEGRYNYEGRASASAFLGWNFGGGNEVTWSLTPIVGGVTGRTSGFVPGFEASVAYRSVDFYTEVEYVFDRNDSNGNFAYAWSELGWKPIEWLRVGIVGQRTRVVHNDRELQRGLLLQVITGKVTLSAYVFNPDNASRYTTLALAVGF